MCRVEGPLFVVHSAGPVCVSSHHLMISQLLCHPFVITRAHTHTTYLILLFSPCIVLARMSSTLIYPFCFVFCCWRSPTLYVSSYPRKNRVNLLAARRNPRVFRFLYSLYVLVCCPVVGFWLKVLMTDAETIEGDLIIVCVCVCTFNREALCVCLCVCVSTTCWW